MKVRKTVQADAIEEVIPLPKCFNGKKVIVTVEEASPQKKDVNTFDKAYSFLMSHTIKSDVTVEEARNARLFGT